MKKEICQEKKIFSVVPESGARYNEDDNDKVSLEFKGVRMKIESKKWMYAGGIMLSVSFAVLFVSRRLEGTAQWYSVHIYPVIVSLIGRMAGYVPVSVSELGLYALILIITVLLIHLIAGLIKGKKGKKEILHFLAGLFFTVSLLFLIYTLNCGINYHRESFSESAGLVTEPYTVEDLKRVCIILTEDVNDYADKVDRDESGVMKLDGSERESAVEAMLLLGETYPELQGYYPKPKGLINPWILSVQNLSGVYSPFTVEANYNSGMTDYNIPFTACHELSHLRGFMQEQEANFIGYLACMESGKAEFNYSGSLLGWIYCMNVLRKVDLEAWKEVRQMLAPEAEVDLRANSEYWARYDGKVAEVADMVNDSYLKANGQSDGVKSYDRMVDLMVTYYKE